eukprot:CAMPEP_0168249234 /NCGR_PEP_ID=MMETSP0141_2-20121125/1890_1 /TAXON_ID=44445 /ORGANISM="Pseudo-nitzschia australis, Strain 10249 10 AB" /LENGTH=680 /DNA_ID=CAMNT_0008185209 /DNA_START=8 /DNA_END=2050 /DNA_ORIENTATION=-
MSAREERLLEVGDEQENTRQEIMEKSKNILSLESRCKDLEGERYSLNEKLKSREERLTKTNDEHKAMKIDIWKKGQMIDTLQASIQSLEKVIDHTTNEASLQNDAMTVLKEIAENLKLDLLKAESDIAAKGAIIKSLEEKFKIEKESKMNLEGDLTIANGNVDESQKIKDDLEKELEIEKRGNKIYEEKLSEALNAIKSLDFSSSEQISRLEAQISKAKDDIAVRAEGELMELNNAKELAASLKEEIDFLQEKASQQKLEQESEKETFVSNIEALKSELQILSLKERSEEVDVLTRNIISLESSKQELKSQLSELAVKIDERDSIIQELKHAISQGGRGEEEIRKECDALKKAEEEARYQLGNIKAEYELATTCEKELTDARLKNMDSVHKQEIGKALSELESISKKLEESESVLAQRSRLLGEVVDHNRDLESKLEKEQTKRERLEVVFAVERNSFECERNECKKVQEALQTRENTLESKLKDERNAKEEVEESLKIMTSKYIETMRAKRNSNELERENKELKNKISRQETYLKRKLQKDKADRTRLTPSKSAGNPVKRITRTPLKSMTNTSSMTNNSCKPLPPSSAYSRSRLQAPCTNGRSIFTGIPYTSTKRRSKVSPSAVSCHSGTSPKSTSSRSVRSTHFHTPVKQAPSLSAQDILQFELDDDQSVASELSFILR